MLCVAVFVGVVVSVLVAAAVVAAAVAVVTFSHRRILAVVVARRAH